MNRFQYFVSPKITEGIGPRETPPHPLPPKSLILNQRAAQKVVIKTVKKSTETPTTNAYRIYRAGRILSLKKTSTGMFPTYHWESHPGHLESDLSEDKSQKILWPERQKRALASLLRKAIKTALEKLSEDLGYQPPPFITLCKAEFQEEELVRAIITEGNSKKEANEKAKEAVSKIWREDPEVQLRQSPYQKKTMTCLTLQECKKILAALQKELDKEEN